MASPNQSSSTILEWLSMERLLVGACSLLIVVTGSLVGIWLSRIDHTVSRVDLHDERLSALDAKVFQCLEQNKRDREDLMDHEIRLRAEERKQ